MQYTTLHKNVEKHSLLSLINCVAVLEWESMLHNAYTITIFLEHLEHSRNWYFRNCTNIMICGQLVSTFMDFKCKKKIFPKEAFFILTGSYLQRHRMLTGKNYEATLVATSPLIPIWLILLRQLSTVRLTKATESFWSRFFALTMTTHLFEFFRLLIE